MPLTARLIEGYVGHLVDVLAAMRFSTSSSSRWAPLRKRRAGATPATAPSSRSRMNAKGPCVRSTETQSESRGQREQDRDERLKGR
jgi:hypothetical protein